MELQHSNALFVQVRKTDEANRVFKDIVLNTKRHGFLPQVLAYNALINGLCKVRRLGDGRRVLKEFGESGNRMQLLILWFNLVAFNCMLDGLGKVGHIDHAMKLFEEMEIKDSFTYTILVHNLFRTGRFLYASKMLVSCLTCGCHGLRTTQRAVIDLLSVGFANETRKLNKVAAFNILLESQYCILRGQLRLELNSKDPNSDNGGLVELMLSGTVEQINYASLQLWSEHPQIASQILNSPIAWIIILNVTLCLGAATYHYLIVWLTALWVPRSYDLESHRK
ncbi:hypothetical protein VNO77_39060 [Canavalia gladiata]|uniref:Pentatricopeptide repeat-containing protein n=1 Tax=Canavalia gladiata TaxID=3824 RepID=A0AAN9KCP4_CANGL